MGAAPEERGKSGEASETTPVSYVSYDATASQGHGGGAQIAGGVGVGGGGSEGGLLALEVVAQEVSGRPGSGASAASATTSVTSLVRDSVETTLARAVAEGVDMMASSPTGR